MSPGSIIAAAFVAALLCGCASVSPSASAAADADRGGALAQDLCAGCHAVSDSHPRPNPNAPPFSSLLSAYDEARLAQDLQNGTLMGHPPLPSVRLNAAGARDLVAYLKSINP